MEREKLEKMKRKAEKEKAEKGKESADKVLTLLATRKKESVMLLFLCSMFDLDKDLLINLYKNVLCSPQ